MLTIAEYMDGRRTERKDVRLPCERDQVAATLEPSRPIIDCLPSRLQAHWCLGAAWDLALTAAPELAPKSQINSELESCQSTRMTTS